MKRELAHIMRSALQNRQCSAAQILVGQSGRRRFFKSYGACDNKSVFDLASLTKPLATALITMRAVQQGLLSLNDPVSKFFRTNNLEDVPVYKLLNHTSSLVAWRAFYPVISAGQKMTDDRHALFQNVLEKILNEPQSRNPKTKNHVVYSDLGYIVMAAILQKVYAKDFDRIFHEEIAIPLHLENEVFFLKCGKKPPVSRNLFVPTHTCPVRQRLVQGEVMDLNCYHLGGVSGHAGLFAGAGAIHAILKELRRARSGKSNLFEKKSFETFCVPPKGRMLSARFFTLGFDTPTRPGSSSGQYFSKNSIGHLGFSGTSFWWDLNRDVWVILLTNRHVFGDGSKRGPFALRPLVHDAIMRQVLEKT